MRTRRLLLSSLLLMIGLGAVLASVAAGAQVEDGVKSATAFPGDDIGAKVNAAFAACAGKPCTVFVPAGDYHFKTTMVVPPGQSFTLRMDSGAFLHYDGNGWALSTSLRAGRSFIRGGHILGNPSAKAGIILLPATQGVYIDEIDVRNFSQGDGILNIGANVVKITNVQVRDNLYGIHLMGSPGYASNNVTVSGSNIVGSARWGIIDGDISLFGANWMGLGMPAGSTSPELGNSFINNNLELNGRDPSGKYGAVLEALTYKSLYSGNYFEASPHHIQIGCLHAPDPVYQRLYGVSGRIAAPAFQPLCEITTSPPARPLMWNYSLLSTQLLMGMQRWDPIRIASLASPAAQFILWSPAIISMDHRSPTRVEGSGSTAMGVKRH